MNRPMKFRLAVVSMVILLYPFSALYAKEAGQVKIAVEPGLSGKILNAEDATNEGTSHSPQFDDQDRYNRLHKEFVQSYNKAESDEERIRLRREFDEESKEYKNSLAEEKESLKKRDIEKERQVLKNEYHKNLRQLEQNHDQKVRRLEKECRKVAIGVEKNWAALEPPMCQKKYVLDEEFQRRLKFLNDDYNASLRELQNE